MGWSEQREEDRDYQWCCGRGPHCYWCGRWTSKEQLLDCFDHGSYVYLDANSHANCHPHANRHSNANPTADTATNRSSNSAADTATDDEPAAKRSSVSPTVPEQPGLFAAGSH
jgi:hypothetical protein